MRNRKLDTILDMPVRRLVDDERFDETARASLYAIAAEFAHVIAGRPTRRRASSVRRTIITSPTHSNPAIIEPDREALMDYLLARAPSVTNDILFIRYAQRVVVKISDPWLYVQGTYTYHQYPGAAGERYPSRIMLLDEVAVAVAAGTRDAYHEWRVRGAGRLSLWDDRGDEIESWYATQGWSEDGIRLFDRIAHAILREPEVQAERERTYGKKASGNA